MADISANNPAAISPPQSDNSLRPRKYMNVMLREVTRIIPKWMPSAVCPKTAIRSAYAKYVPGNFMFHAASKVLHLFEKTENYLDPCEIYAQIVCESLNLAQSLDVSVGGGIEGFHIAEIMPRGTARCHW